MVQVKINKEVDLVQLGILTCMGLTMLGSLVAYCSMTYATKDSVAVMQTQMSQIYEKIIPEAERKH